MAYLISKDWTRVRTLTGIETGKTLTIQNAGRAGDLIEVIISDLEPSISDRGHVVRSLDPVIQISGQTSDIWVRYIRYDLCGTITPEPQKKCLANITDENFIGPKTGASGSNSINTEGESALLYDILMSIKESNTKVLSQLRLLNARYEEATETRIKLRDINHAD